MSFSVGTTDYGYDLSELPIASGSNPGANVITIAFASMNYAEYATFFFLARKHFLQMNLFASYFYDNGCQPYVSGLHLFGLNGMDATRYQV